MAHGRSQRDILEQLPVVAESVVAQNVLDGTMPQWQAQDLDEVMAHTLVLDVRSRSEYAEGHLEGALNIPHLELRQRCVGVALRIARRLLERTQLVCECVQFGLSLTQRFAFILERRIAQTVRVKLHVRRAVQQIERGLPRQRSRREQALHAFVHRLIGRVTAEDRDEDDERQAEPDRA